MEIFNCKEFGELRVIDLNDTFYFIGKDVADALGYKRADNAIRSHVSEEDKLTHQVKGADQRRTMTIINESGLYSLILSSKLESAKRFKKWVTGEVLPSLRRHGMYATDELLNDPDLLIQVATELKKEKEARAKLESDINIKKNIIKRLEPKAAYYDSILNSKELLTTTHIAKDYGYSARSFNQLLNKLGIQYKQSRQWFLYAKYEDKGYTHSSTAEIRLKNGGVKVVTNTKWTQRGRLFLYKFLKDTGIIPSIEKNDF